ncbi:MAG: hypothetical protein WBW47_01915 [Thermoplasmata archaeon]
MRAGRLFTLQFRAGEAGPAALGAEGVPPFFLLDRTHAVPGTPASEFFPHVLELVAGQHPP